MKVVKHTWPEGRANATRLAGTIWGGREEGAKALTPSAESGMGRRYGGSGEVKVAPVVVTEDEEEEDDEEEEEPEAVVAVV